MKTRSFLVPALLALCACGPGGPEGREWDGDESASVTAELDGDNDLDGIVDTAETQLALKFAPEVRLHPSDWTRPATVSWYLARVTMRFDHSGCPDHQIIALGSVTQDSLSAQSHATTNWYCGHTSTVYHSNAAHLEFFLQPPDDATHSGTTSGWRVYAHVKSSVVVAGGYDLQYWFFYPYNDAIADFNHEADWEHITVTTDAAGNFQSAWYAQHDSGVRYTASQLRWVGGTHPVVYSAQGTHASYPGPGTWDGPVVPDYASDGGPLWDTWNNLLNVGERAAPLNGATFLKYGGRWGEIGELDITSGPPTPSFQGSWNRY